MTTISSSIRELEVGTLEWLYNCVGRASRTWPYNRETNSNTVRALDMPNVEISPEHKLRGFDVFPAQKNRTT